jgi:hypothetical protein
MGDPLLGDAILCDPLASFKLSLVAQGRLRPIHISKAWAWIIGVILLCGLAPISCAVRSFARQTGMACSTCHTVVPELAPFGREFNAKDGGADSNDHELILGVTLNNKPAVQDVWNTTPAWGFPHSGTSVQM